MYFEIFQIQKHWYLIQRYLYFPRENTLLLNPVTNKKVKVKHLFFQLPQSEQEWLAVSNGFQETWDFPHAIGALDGKHISIQAPFRTGTEYYNYKKFFSIVLLALVDSNYNFMYVNVGCQGRISDGGVFRNSLLYQMLENQQLNVPASEILNIPYVKKIPYVILGDQAFALNRYMMTPFSGVHQKGSKERIFNYRLSRARRVVENAFGIMTSKFRVLRKAMILKPTSAKKIVLACVHLHNFLRRDCLLNSSNTPTSEAVGALQNQIPDATPTDNRNFLANHFVTNGSIPYQCNY